MSSRCRFGNQRCTAADFTPVHTPYTICYAFNANKSGTLQTDTFGKEV